MLEFKVIQELKPNTEILKIIKSYAYILNYYEIDLPDHFDEEITTHPKNELEKIIRIITLEKDDKLKKVKVKVGVITIYKSIVITQKYNLFIKEY